MIRGTEHERVDDRDDAAVRLRKMQLIEFGNDTAHDFGIVHR